MYESIALGTIVLLILVPIGVAAWWGLLRLMDRAARISFRYTVDRIEHDPIAASIYFGLRAVASAYLVANLFSRFI